MHFPKLFIGPMSQNIIDNVLISHFNIGLIPSRRQIEFNGGYVNNWTTKEFVEYVRKINDKVIICRDHAGPLQGKFEDSGVFSIINDCFYMNIIHIDPWKTDFTFKECLYETVKLMRLCYKHNSNVFFEIGTEEGIRKLSPDQVYDLIKYVKDNVPFFENVKYVVIQSGTNLKMDMNTGEYQESRLIEMIKVVKEFGILSKEHNGDYIESLIIKSKFKKGLDAINIAPEFGRMETECYLEQMNIDEFEKFFNICYESRKWFKWLKGDNSFNPFENKERLIKVCGHYVFSDNRFIELVKNIDIKKCLFEKMNKRISDILEEV
jgi:hypothetical protein